MSALGRRKDATGTWHIKDAANYSAQNSSPRKELSVVQMLIMLRLRNPDFPKNLEHDSRIPKVSMVAHSTLGSSNNIWKTSDEP